jgi:HEAT repeat protein
MLRLAALALAAAALTAIDEAQVLSATRAANAEYQNRFQTIAKGLAAANEAQRIAAVYALGELREPRVVPLLVPWVLQAQRSPAEQIAVIIVLGRLGYDTPVPQLRSFAASPDVGVRQVAVSALQQIGAINAGDWMLRAEEDDDALRLNALAALGHLSYAEATAALIAGLSHEKSLIRQSACIGLGRLGDKANGEKLKIALTDADPMVRRYAAEALAKLGYKEAVPDLLMALEANVAGTYILRALRVLTGSDFGFDPNAPLTKRQEAIERGFAWMTAHP